MGRSAHKILLEIGFKDANEVKVIVTEMTIRINHRELLAKIKPQGRIRVEYVRDPNFLVPTANPGLHRGGRSRSRAVRHRQYE